MDLVIGNNNFQANQLFTNDGSGVFTSSEAFPGGSADTCAVALGDLNGDGWLDVFVGNTGANELLLNTGSGAFISDSSLSGGSSDTRALALGDVDAGVTIRRSNL